MATVTLTTGAPASLLGTLNIAAALVDNAATRIQLQFDISQHTATNTAALNAVAEISFDAGLTWNPLCACGRDKGYNGDSGSIAFVSTSLPPGTGRMVRASLTSTASVTTSMQAVMA